MLQDNIPFPQLIRPLPVTFRLFREKDFLALSIGFTFDDVVSIALEIEGDLKEVFTVEELAARKNMSVSAFQQKFKSAAGMGPLQCQKRLRLTEARRLMLDENVSVREASTEVGYKSVSQFI